MSLGPSYVQMEQRSSLSHCQPGDQNPFPKHVFCFTKLRKGWAQAQVSFLGEQIHKEVGGELEAAVVPGFLLLQRDKPYGKGH